MTRFYHETSSSWLKQAASAILFIVLFVMFFLGISQMSEETSEKQTETLHTAISRGIAHCYATEGQYPESLEYLLEKYGIQYDTDKYFIDYQVWGQNFFPDVTIIEK